MLPEVRLTVIQGMSPGREYVFRDPTVCTIGRGADCLLHLPSSIAYLDVSRHHCALEIDPPLVRVRDLGSKNGTYVNGELIGRRDWGGLTPDDLPEWEVNDGDEVRVGGTVFRVDIIGVPELAESVH
jgi:pSer/pThr/pTyr-binding forkhead associated (FHA) protein